MTDANELDGLDRLHIDELKFECIIGVNESERLKPQEVVVSATLFADLSAACVTDCLDDSVDYKALKLAILEMGKASRFRLIEKLAEKIADICLADARVRRAMVRVEKPGALRWTRTVWVEITRSR